MAKGFVIVCCLAWMSSSAWAQSVGVVKFDAVRKLLNRPTDTTYVVNFWATWCKPCVSELPHFERLYAETRSKKVKIVLISLDFVSDLQAKVTPFVQKRQMKNTVWLLNETDYNLFIEQVDRTWTGVIPATLIFNNARRKRKFLEKELSYEVLAQELREF